MFEWLLVLCLALALHPFPRRRQILAIGNHSVQQTRFWLLPNSSCLFCLVDMKDHQMVQSAVRNGRTEVRFYPLHGRKWFLTEWQGEFFPAQWLGAQKSSLLHLMIAQAPPVLSHCQLLIQESTWESPAAPSTRPPWSHLYTTEGLHPRVPQSPLLVREGKNNSCIFFNTIQSVCSITL